MYDPVTSVRGTLRRKENKRPLRNQGINRTSERRKEETGKDRTERESGGWNIPRDVKRRDGRYE